MKIIGFLLAIIMMLSFCSCGKDSVNLDASEFDPNTADPSEFADYIIGSALAMNEREENFEKNQKKVSGAEIYVADAYEIKIKSYGIEYSDFYKSDIITIKADFTNLFDRNTSFLNFRADITAYQDGIVLSEVFGDYDQELGTSIKPGKTIEVAFSYILRNTDSDLELEGMDMEQNPDTCSFKLK